MCMYGIIQHLSYNFNLCNQFKFISNIFVGLLRQKDVEQALLLEEKMALQLRLLAAAGLDPPSPPSYRHLVSEKADTDQMWKDVLTAVQVTLMYIKNIINF